MRRLLLPVGQKKTFVALTPATPGRGENSLTGAQAWVKATLACACTLTPIRRGVGGTNCSHNFGDAKRDANTYT